MQFATVLAGGVAKSGIVQDGGTRLAVFPGGAGLRAFIAGGGVAGESAEAIDLAGARYLAPIPDPGKLLCLAGNYRAHIVESGFQAPAVNDVISPQFFLKPSTCLTGHEAEIPLRAENRAVGWEVELVVVIGKRGRNIARQDALAHVFGYTLLNDVSERRLNSTLPDRRKRDNDAFFDWLAGKWFDGFAPCGPVVVAAAGIPDPHALPLRLSVNGELRQQGSTADMLFRIDEQIAYISRIATLEPGDLIATGTPAGAGLGTGSTALSDGDVVECEIEGIGALRNTVRAVS